ncbi:hypothetical protein [Duganella vulcania]|uniref:Uncharacterized protein n=1 Tax=Duganella vulcania TaxID=2692166 RepID=A0A845GI11_9BURK|nr:hypothetical protein [Duganella vulcania]MYM92309.1 hypothetical protein [Duganella vulcania]
MQVKILFPYSEMVVPPRCRKPRLQHFNDGQFTIDIAEVSGADAPVAIRSSGVFMARSNVRFAVDYRWWRGCLWTSLRVDAVEPRGMTSGHDDWDYASWPAVLDLTSPANSGSSYEFGIYGPRSEPRLAWEEYLSIVAGSHLIIDGVPHRIAGEPRYVVMTFGMAAIMVARPAWSMLITTATSTVIAISACSNVIARSLQLPRSRPGAVTPVLCQLFRMDRSGRS